VKNIFVRMQLRDFQLRCLSAKYLSEEIYRKVVWWEKICDHVY